MDSWTLGLSVLKTNRIANFLVLHLHRYLLCLFYRNSSKFSKLLLLLLHFLMLNISCFREAKLLLHIWERKWRKCVCVWEREILCVCVCRFWLKWENHWWGQRGYFSTSVSCFETKKYKICFRHFQVNIFLER